MRPVGDQEDARRIGAGIDLTTDGERSEGALRLRFVSGDAELTFDLGSVETEPVPFTAGKWHHVKLAFDGGQGWYDVWVDGGKVKERGDVRLLFLDGEPSAQGLDAEDLPGAGVKVPESVFWIDDVKTTGK